MESVKIPCPTCGSDAIKRNGHTHYGKQNYRCNACGRQFVANGSDWFVSDRDKELVDKLLLERISLNGICRVVGVSPGWLQGYIKELYAGLPDDLGADQALPDLDEYLSERMDEEIGRLEVIKKIRRHLKRLTT
jgi:DNA-directed RNA polymerase subunit RPC12/RpoP